MKAVIAGANGQLGQAFQKEFSRRNIAFCGTDMDTCDISKSDQVNALLDQHKPSVFFNCASYNLVEDAELKPDLAFLVNAHAVKVLASACQARGIKFVHFGTDYVFDGQKYDFYTEEDAAHPLNVYGSSKLEGEQNTQSSGADHLVLRTSWLYGNGQQNFLYKLLQWTQKNKILRISSDEVSVPTNAEDLVQVSLKALDKGLKGLYHVTNSGYASRYELAKYFLKTINKDVLVIPVPMSNFPSKVARPLFSAMSNRKITHDLGVSIPSWQEGIEKHVHDNKII